MVPTTAEIAELKVALASFSPIVISGDIKADKRETLLTECEETTSLVITTPAFSFVTIRALGEIIIERVSAGTYRMPRRPHLDWVMALSLYAESRELTLTLGDYPLPLEHRPKPEAALSFEPKNTAVAVDVRELRAQGEVWRALPEGTLKEIKKCLK